VHGSVRPLVALILTKNCLNWVKLSVMGRICCNLVATECNSDFACCGNVVYLGFCLLWNWTSLISIAVEKSSFYCSIQYKTILIFLEKIYTSFCTTAT